MFERRVVAQLIGAVATVLAVSVPALAQNGRVGGVVRGEGGQPLKGATVTADMASHRAEFHRHDRRQGTLQHDRPSQW